MTVGITVHIEGAKAIEKALKSLETKVARKVVRQALRAGANQEKRAIKANAPVDTGRLRRSIVVRVPRKQRGQRRPPGGYYMLQVIPSTKREPDLVSYTKDGKRQYYPAVLEFGTKTRAPHAFFRGAHDRIKRAALKTILAVMKQKVDEQVIKARRKR